MRSRTSLSSLADLRWLRRRERGCGQVAGTVYSSSGALEGRVVNPPARNPRPAPRTEYVYVQNKGTNAQQGRKLTGISPGKARTPSGVPAFLGNREIIFGTWAVSMALVTVDDWKTNNILVRPSRLWGTTLVYAGLALVSTIDALVPIANALAIGYTIVLLYQFFSKQGQFSGSKA